MVKEAADVTATVTAAAAWFAETFQADGIGKLTAHRHALSLHGQVYAALLRAKDAEIDRWIQHWRKADQEWAADRALGQWLLAEARAEIDSLRETLAALSDSELLHDIRNSLTELQNRSEAVQRGDFYEEDEPVAEVVSAFERGLAAVSRTPQHIVTPEGRVLTDADIEDLADEAGKGYEFCRVCKHRIQLMGEPNTSQYWQCVHRCRCMMTGCVFDDPKYDGGAP